jgi:cyclase
MLKKRLIPVILLRNGIIVQSRSFKRYQALGSPTAAVERLSNWASDELIYLDISSSVQYDLNREDLNHPVYSTIKEIISLVSKKCNIPLTFGGGIRNLDDAALRINLGADKITLNTAAIENPSLIREISKIYGKQCVVVSIDVKKEENGKYIVYKRGKEPTLFDPITFAKKMEDEGAGEVLLNSVNNDGARNGFDLELINTVSESIKIPLIAMGGAGTWQHFEDVLTQTAASAVAAANIFQHTENSVFNCKKHLYEQGLNVRRPSELSDLKSNL